MAVSGIDVSKWQGKIDWKKVKAAGVEFALLRAGYGDTLSYPYQIDPEFERNYKSCKENSMPVGVYWYSYATTVEMAQQEAKSCIAVLEGKQFEYPIYYDVEELRIFNSGKTNEIIRAFCSAMEKAGYWVGIYIYRFALEKYVLPEVASRYAVAVAEYADKCNYKGQYGIWQNSSTWRVDGISGDVDHDWCYVDYPRLIKERGKNGYAPSGEVRVRAKRALDLFRGTDRPPVDVQYKKGDQCTVEKTMMVGSETWGKVKGREAWLNMADVETV